ncbi:MAG: hypothetical protein J1E85_10385 [Ruminococcus sp.]|nr:hypothetical protein [Ruminococcus sp.]
MKHLQKAEDKRSERAYLFIVGALMKLVELAKVVCKGVLKHYTETLMVIAFVGIIIAVQAFDNGAINYTVTILFVTILFVLMITLIKVKILEKRGEK